MSSCQKNNLFIATDDKELPKVDENGYNFIMTSKNVTGTDRVTETSKKLNLIFI